MFKNICVCVCENRNNFNIIKNKHDFLITLMMYNIVYIKLVYLVQLI
jgi:hypothetical protein